MSAIFSLAILFVVFLVFSALLILVIGSIFRKERGKLVNKVKRVVLRFDDLYSKYKEKLRIERYDEYEGENRYLCFSLGSMLLSEEQTFWFLEMVHCRANGDTNEKIKMQIAEKEGKWRPQIKFGSFGSFDDITINYYGDLDDTNELIEFNSKAEAEAYVEKATRRNRVSDSNDRVFAFQSEGNEGKPFIN